jgi:hypothetical protein
LENLLLFNNKIKNKSVHKSHYIPKTIQWIEIRKKKKEKKEEEAIFCHLRYLMGW